MHCKNAGFRHRLDQEWNSCEPWLVWFKLPGIRNQNANRDDHRVCHHLAGLITGQLQLPGVVLVEAPTRPPIWMLNELAGIRMHPRLHMATRRWCSMNLWPGDPPLQAETTLLCTRHLDSWPCRCSVSLQGHVGTRDEPQKLREARIQFLSCLIQDLVGIRPELPTEPHTDSPAVLAEPLEPDQPHETPTVRALLVADPASRAVAGTDAPHHDVGNPVKSAVEAYPTVERKRAKAAEAERKARGEEHVPRKKPQTVEQHFDDCGSDLSALDAAAGAEAHSAATGGAEASSRSSR